MSEGPSINIGSITGGQNNIGKNEIAGDQVQHNAGSEPVTIEQFTHALEKAEGLPDEIRNETIPDIHAIANLSSDEQQKFIDTDKWMTMAEKIRPYATSIGKSVAVFGAAALKALASKNPIVAGVMAVCEQQKPKENQSDYQQQYEEPQRYQDYSRPIDSRFQ